eukprot:scaffold25751_cov57-Attheya_sp.AAC.2
MESPTAKANGDVWWKFSSFVAAFNHTCLVTMILSGCAVVLDESISVFVPRVGCGDVAENSGGGIFMRPKRYFAMHGATASCVMHATTEAGQSFDYSPDDEEIAGGDLDDFRTHIHYDGDSWFGSVKAAAAVGSLGDHACMIIKTGHTLSPKKWLDDTMKDFPGGTWIVLEGRANPEGQDLVCIGYTYNNKKVLTFVMTQGW